MTEFSTTATETLYLNLRIVERKDQQITKRNWLPNLTFRIAWDCAIETIAENNHHKLTIKNKNNDCGSFMVRRGRGWAIISS
jgi:hypothetical protein